MKTWNLIKYDLNEGIRYRAIYFTLPFIVALFSCIGLHSGIRDIYTETNIGNGTFMDYWIYLVQGGEAYQFSVYDIFEIPVRWVCFYTFLLIGLNNYPMNELQSRGYQILIHSKSRLHWWLSKIIWVFSFTAVYFAVNIVTVAAYSLSYNAKLSFRASPDIMSLFSQAKFSQCSNIFLIFTTFLLPYIFAFLLGVLHLLFTNLIHPMHSLVILVCILIVSTYRKHWLLFGNMATPYRMLPVDKHGIKPLPSFAFLTAASAITIVVGYLLFKKRDIYEAKE